MHKHFEVWCQLSKWDHPNPWCWRITTQALHRSLAIHLSVVLHIFTTVWHWWFTVLFWSGGNPSHPPFSQTPLHRTVTQIATNSCFSVSKGLASLWMLLIFPWEREKLCCSSQIYLRGPISKSLKLLQWFAKLIKNILLPLWGPFNPYMKVSAYFGWYQLSIGSPWQQDGACSNNGKVGKGLAWTAAPQE